MNSFRFVYIETYQRRSLAPVRYAVAQYIHFVGDKDMKLEWKNDLIGGVILSVFSISGNALYADPHRNSIFPNILSLIVFVVVLACSMRALRTAIINSPNPKIAFIYVGFEVTLSCAIVLTISFISYDLFIGFPFNIYFILFDLLSVIVSGIILTPVLWIFRSLIFHSSSATA